MNDPFNSLSGKIYFQVDREKVSVSPQPPYAGSGPTKKPEHQKPPPLSTILPDDAITPSDVKVEVKRSEHRVLTTSSQTSTYTSDSPAKSGPESQFRANYVKEVRTPTDFPDPRSPTSKFSDVTEQTRTPTDFTDPRSPTTRFTKFDSQVQRTVTTKRTVIQNGEATTQVTESKSFVTHHDEGEGPAKIDIKSLANDPKAIAEVVKKLKIDEEEGEVNTRVTEATNKSEDGKTSSYVKATEQSAATDDGLRSSFTREVVSTTSTINQTPSEPVSVIIVMRS